MQIQYTNTNTNTDTEYIYNLARKLKKRVLYKKGSFPKKLIKNFLLQKILKIPYKKNKVFFLIYKKLENL